MEAWAHSSGLGISGNSKPGHLLADHLRAVAALAAGFSDGFGSREWGYLAGLWHDLGKYRDGFQRYIRQSRDPDAPIEGRVCRRQQPSVARSSLSARNK